MTKSIVPVMMFLALHLTAISQTIVPATTVDDPFPTSSLPGSTYFNASCYDNEYLLLFAMDDAFNDPTYNPSNSTHGVFVWRIMDTPYDTSQICGQDTFLYPAGTNSIEVGAVDPNNGYFSVFVAYHKAGVGHIVDIYEADVVNCTMTLDTSMQISSVTTRTRISMNTHLQYAVAFSWTDAAGNLFAKVALAPFGGGIVWGNTVSVNDPGSNRQNVDIAFSHNGNNTWVHYVYYDYPGGANGPEFYKGHFDFYGALQGGISTINGSTDDVFAWNNTSCTNDEQRFPEIDCPDHDSDSWAYTIDDYGGQDIHVRLSNNGAVPQTICLTDGSLTGTANISGCFNQEACLSYVFVNGSGNQLYVMFSTLHSNPAIRTNGVIYSMILSEAGALISPSHLLAVKNNPQIKATSLVSAMHKSNDNTGFLYAGYVAELGGSDLLFHKYHPWSNTTSFKWDEFSDFHSANGNFYLKAFPNPFINEISLMGGNSFEIGTQVSAVIFDSKATQIFECSGSLEEINTKLNNMKSLANGFYFIQVSDRTSGQALYSDKLIKE